MTCRPIRHGPNTFSPPIGVTCQDGPAWLPRATAFPAWPGLAGRSDSSRSSSARVRAVVASSIRWLNSSSVSRPSPVAWLSRSTVASRSASDARTPSAGLAVAGGLAHCCSRLWRRNVSATTITAGPARSVVLAGLRRGPGPLRRPAGGRGRCRVRGRPQFTRPDADDSGENERAAEELQRRRQLAEQQPGEQDREQDLGHADERGELGPEPAGRADAGHVGDDRGQHGQPEHRHDPADPVTEEGDVGGRGGHRQHADPAERGESGRARRTSRPRPSRSAAAAHRRRPTARSRWPGPPRPAGPTSPRSGRSAPRRSGRAPGTARRSPTPCR